MTHHKHIEEAYLCPNSGKPHPESNPKSGKIHPEIKMISYNHMKIIRCPECEARIYSGYDPNLGIGDYKVLGLWETP